LTGRDAHRNNGPKGRRAAARKGDATLDEARHLKELVGRMGEPRFRDLIDLLCM
jgi:hypothetical protein